VALKTRFFLLNMGSKRIDPLAADIVHDIHNFNNNNVAHTWEETDDHNWHVAYGQCVTHEEYHTLYDFQRMSR